MVRIRLGLIVVAIFLSISTSATRPASAGQVQTLPSQQIPEPQPTPPPMTRQPGEDLIIPPRLPAPQGNTREIPLPEVFRGCWAATVPRVDSVQPLTPNAGIPIWLTKTYTLCYKQAGDSGKWQLTFAEG